MPENISPLGKELSRRLGDEVDGTGTIENEAEVAPKRPKIFAAVPRCGGAKVLKKVIFLPERGGAFMDASW
jgi:hypothetical protein